MNDNNYIKKNEKTASRTIDGQAVIMTIEDNTLHTLNEVGTRIWDLCDGERTLDDIAMIIHEEFQVEYEEAQADCKAFLEELRAKSMVCG
ncbi:MAG: PqqD family protein [bacterium]